MNPEIFIQNINNDKKYKKIFIDIFTSGYCYHFASIMNSLFEGYIVYNPIDNHFAFLDKFTGNIFDITGKIGYYNNDSTDIWKLWDLYKIEEPIESKRIIEQCIYKEY